MIKILSRITHSPNSLRGAAVLLMITLLLSNILGAARNYFLTRTIPVESLDIYYAAFRLPDFIFTILIMGTIFSAFIPIFTEALERDEETAWYIANTILTITTTFITGTLFVLFFLLPYLMKIVVPNFTPAAQHETVQVARILLLSPIFFGISNIFGGILNSARRFVAYSLAPLIYNLSIIVGASVIAPLYARGDHRQLTAVALAVVVGAFLHMFIQWPSVRHLGLRFRFIFDTKHQEVRKIAKLMIPRTIGLGADQLQLITFTALASAIPGAVSYYSLANDIQTMPTVVFGISFATAVFPSLASAAAKQNQEHFSDYLTRTVNIIVSLLIPATIGLILLRVGIVHVLLGFNIPHVIATANALAAFSLSLLASGLVPLFSRAFYAQKDTRTPMVIGIIAIIFSIFMALSAPSIGRYLAEINFRYWRIFEGAAGLAFSYSFGAFINAGLLYIFLRRRYAPFQEGIIFSTFAKVVIASLIMGATIYLSSHLVANYLDVSRTRIGMLSQVGIAVAIGTVTYLALAWILKIKEVRALWRRNIASSTAKI